MQTRFRDTNGIQHHTPAGRIYKALCLFGLLDGRRESADTVILHNVAIVDLQTAYAALR